MEMKAPQLVNINKEYYYKQYGQLSYDSFIYAEEYSNNFAVVWLDGKFKYRDILGNISKDGYMLASKYIGNHAIVRLDDKKFAIRDEKGQLGQERFDSINQIKLLKSGSAYIKLNGTVLLRDPTGKLHFIYNEQKQKLIMDTMFQNDNLGL